MNKRSILRIQLLVGSILLCYCAAPRKQEPKASNTESNRQEEKRKTSVADFKQLYESAQSQFERRAVCLRTIDEGALHRGVSVSVLDEIFGTHFASNLPTKEEAKSIGVVHFIPDAPSPPSPDGKIAARGYVGWFLAVEFDPNGDVQNYYLSNIHKGSSSGEEGKVPSTVAALKQLYATANSEDMRREVCLRAIDEGVIRTFGSARISTIDEIFGTHFAAALPTRKERTRQVRVLFTTLSSLSSSQNSRAVAAEPTGWFMVIEYYYDGSISNYYLTNLH